MHAAFRCFKLPMRKLIPIAMSLYKFKDSVNITYAHLPEYYKINLMISQMDVHSQSKIL